MNTDPLHITNAEYLTDYVLKLTFSTSEIRVFDFSKVFDKGIMTKLQNLA